MFGAFVSVTRAQASHARVASRTTIRSENGGHQTEGRRGGQCNNIAVGANCSQNGIR